MTSTYAHLLPVSVGGTAGWKSKIHSWLGEDIPKFDIGGFVVGDNPSEAKILMKSPGVCLYFVRPPSLVGFAAI